MNNSEINTITDLKVNSIKNPLGLDERPVFSWVVNMPDSFDKAQTAYQIKVSSDVDKALKGEADIWDSGEVLSDNTTSVLYLGNKLASRTTYYWTVKSAVGEVEIASEMGYFSTGASEWQGSWIGDASGDLKNKAARPALMLRKEFEVDASKTISSAMIYICGLGFFDLKINGVSPDDSVLNPFTTQYDRTVLYRTFDVTSFIEGGSNAIGVELGNSFYNETVHIWNWDTAAWRDNQKMILNMEVIFEDGTKQTIVTDETWKMTTDGPIQDNSMYYGETYDANKEQLGFDLPGFDDSAWSAASKVSAPTGILKSHLKAPVKRTNKYLPEQIVKLPNGSLIIKSPEMVSGWLKLININENKGTKITITYGQRLKDDGQVERWGGHDGRDSNGFPYANLQQDNYICKGTLNESFEPKFSYKGFLYAQIDGLRNELGQDDITIYRVSNGIDVISKFETSDEMINKLHKMMRTSIANNFQGEHCDPLIEKNGWLGDVNVSLPSMMYNFDMTGCLPGFIDVMEDGFNMHGTVPIMVPTSNWGVHNYPVWNSIFVFGVKNLQDYFGTNEYTKRQYDVMRKFALQDIDQIKDNGWVWGDTELADWVSPMGGTDPNVPYDEQSSEGSGIVATGYVYKVLDVMAEFADQLGKAEDSAVYRGAMTKIYTAFNDKFYKPDRKIYETMVWNQLGSRTKYRQTSNLVPLAFGLVPEDMVEDVVSNLVKNIEEKNNHLDTGCVGTRLILPVLCDHGYADLAYKILKQKTYPSWGFWVEQGSASLWEMWETTSRSFDHYFLGTYEEWFFSRLAGIRDVVDGYKCFSIKPNVINDLEYVKCEINTVRGKVASSWEFQHDGRFMLSVEIPVGSQAQIHLPTNSADGLTVNADSADIAQGVKSMEEADGKIVLTVGSGKYEIWSTCSDREISAI